MSKVHQTLVQTVLQPIVTEETSLEQIIETIHPDLVGPMVH